VPPDAFTAPYQQWVWRSARFFDHFLDVAIETKYALLANLDTPSAKAPLCLAALPDAPSAHAAPALVLTSIDAPLAPPLADGTTCGADPLCVLTGAGASTPPKLAAALITR
jgi:hypothetical protein